MILRFTVISILLNHKIMSASVGIIIFILVSYIFQAIRRFLTLDKQCCSSFNKPIDVVYTWVNGSDHHFLNNLQSYLNCSEKKSLVQRFDDKNELKFSLRSLEKFAPWIGHVYVVTNGQIPYWLNLDYEKVSVVTHEEIFENRLRDLPTFSSPAIESHLHRIPGLSEKFIYFNDDVFLGEKVFPEDFYSENEGHVVYLSWTLPPCRTDCPWVYVGDDECDLPCLNRDCQMDGGDCDHPTINEIKSVNSKTFNKSALTAQEKFQKFATPHSSFDFVEIVEKHNSEVIFNDKIERKKRKSKISNGKKTKCEIIEDAYKISLQHTNRILNKKYGFYARYTPAHVPILIDKKIMYELQKDFAEEFDITSRNNVRKGNDMQYSLSYYYYLVHETRTRGISEIFDMFDVDFSGTWSDREIRTILTKINQLPLTYEMVDDFENLILNCTSYSDDYLKKIQVPKFERYVDSKLPLFVTKKLITDCQDVSLKLKNHLEVVDKYKKKIIKNSQDTKAIFKMLTSNVSHVIGHLDEIRKRPKKFVCLNDNMESFFDSENNMVRAVLYDFYISLFPIKSKFELPHDLKNRFTNVKDLKKWKSYHNKVLVVIYLCFALLLYLTFQHFCKNRILYRCLNKIFC